MNFSSNSSKLSMNAKPGTVTGTVEPEKQLKGWKKVYGHFAVEPDGTIFLSWAHAGCSQAEVFFCASYDGEPVMLLEETSLYRAQWLWDNFPRMRQAISRAIKRISEAQQKGLEPFSG
jgi:hypothetical protein